MVTRHDLAYTQVGPEGTMGIGTPTETWHREEHGAEIFSAVIPIPESHVEVRVEHYPGLRIVFQETGCCDGKFVLPTLRPLIDEVARIVNDFEARGLLR